MRQICIFIIIIINISLCFSQSTDQEQYSGGMLILQPGYMVTSNFRQEIRGMNYGIGGILRFYFSGYFTTGIYGGSARTGYNTAGSGNSYFNLGYGGVFVGLSHREVKWRYTFSAFAGGGKIKNLHIESQDHESLSGAYLFKEAVFVFSPVVSLDYFISRKISVTIQAVCLTARTDDSRMMYNPVCQIGLLFNR